MILPKISSHQDIGLVRHGDFMNKQDKVGVVMKEFSDGKLKSSSGDKVTNRNQAMAIALSEAGISKKMFAGGKAGDGKIVQGFTKGRIV